MAGREFGPPPARVQEFDSVWRNWLYLVFRKVYKRTYSFDLLLVGSFSPGSNPMTDVVAGIASGAYADATTDESRNTAFTVPLDWVPGTAMTVNVRFSNSAAQTGVKNVITKLVYNAVDLGETINAAGTTLTDTVTLASGVAANTFHETGDYTIPAATLALGATIFLHLIRDATTDTCTGDVGYQVIIIEYTGFINHE